jgi:predicted tellurium resistance membrane protein TerC
MSRGGSNNPRGARYWVITAVITWLLLMTPMPFTLLAFGWLIYRARKYINDKKKEQAKVTSRLNTRLVNIMLRNGKQLINVEALDEDDRFLKVVDAEGKELLIDRNYIAVVEPVEQELD